MANLEVDAVGKLEPSQGAVRVEGAAQLGESPTLEPKQHAFGFHRPRKPQGTGQLLQLKEPAGPLGLADAGGDSVQNREGRQQFRYASGWGTFRDSMRAPVHSWFTYPAGFSYQAVAHGIRLHRVAAGMTIYDPFMGTGTTNVEAKSQGINSLGVEAHPFVYNVARAKMAWNLDVAEAQRALAEVVAAARNCQGSQRSAEMPALVLKCFEPQVLSDLLRLRDMLEAQTSGEVRLFLRTALTSVLRRVSSVQTGWPYIAPNKPRKNVAGLCAFSAFAERVNSMLADVVSVRSHAHPAWADTAHGLHLADARDTAEFIGAQSVDFIFTSPPYLNNYDYADRTRMEMYFFGEASNWRDITEGVRNRLMTAATTQVSRRDPWELSAELRDDCGAVHRFLADAIARLAELRLSRGGKKDYDIVTCGYFNDIHRVLRDCYRALRPRSCAVFVLGDSAPYGVHIPTDKLVGEIAQGVGFKDYQLEVLRKRGDKWKRNPQRHSRALRESVVTLRKG